ncbi:hypothetical protein ABZ805_06960 [Saccharopolyspora sp. NPDC047091]|uniref:hypothetical protein n=1 Tax=Saccharopolyspora sp. NPDC047091 TaxID=3155924 RepID=UPI0033DDA007
MQQGSARPSLGPLVAEWCGAHVLVRCEGEDPAERAFLAHLPSAANELFLSASRGACADPELLPALPGLLRPLLRAAAAVPHVLWLGVSGLAGRADDLTKLAVDLELDVVAPDGAVSGESGTTVHAGRVSGGTGWYLFRPGSRPWLFSTRYPIPAWERWVPIQPVANPQLLVDPVPAGLLVRDPRSSWAEVRRAAARVPVSGKVPKVLLAGRPLPAPAEVAQLLQALPEFVRASVVLIPVAAAAARHEWLVELSARLSRPVVFSTGAEFADGPRRQPVAAVLDEAGDEVFRPFVSALRQPAGAGDQQVVDIAEPPAGWQRCGQRTYRPAQGPTVFAEVVPSGLALRDEQGAPLVVSLAAAGAFDPARWVLHLVPADGALSEDVLGGLRHLLASLDEKRRRTAIIRVWGPLDHGPNAELHALAEPFGVPVSSNGRPVERDAEQEAAELPAGAAGTAAPPGTAVPPGVAVPPGTAVPPGAAAPAVPPGVAGPGVAGPPGAVAPGPAAAPDSAAQPGSAAPGGEPGTGRPDAGEPAAEAGGTAEVDEAAEADEQLDWKPAAPVAAPIATVSAAPVPTMSGMPHRSTVDEPLQDVPISEPAASEPPAERVPDEQPEPPVPAEPPAAPPAAPPGAPEAPPVAEREPAPEPQPESEVDFSRPVVESGRPSVESGPPQVESAPDAQLEPEPVVEDAELEDAELAEDEPAEDEAEQAEPGESAAPLTPRDLRDKSSSGGEQSRFTTAAGPSFSDALATVNAAMASWPSLRQDDSAGAKADFVAVCLYLGRGEGGAEQVNEALRGGVQPELDGHLPCLVSGIRRLPTHRRPVLRQSVLKGTAEENSTPGTLFVEPGFLSASMNLDVTVPGAMVDVLIWPHRARRTSELALNRPMDEVVFLAGTRFKTLAVRDLDEQENEDEAEERDEDAIAPPKMAVLFREMAPDERATSTELDERDLAALSKLDRALARRQRGTLRMLEDSDAMARLTGTMVETDLATAGAPQEERRDTLITTGGQVGHP